MSQERFGDNNNNEEKPTLDTQGEKPGLSNYLQWVKNWLDHVRENEGGGIPVNKVYRTVQDTVDPKNPLNSKVPPAALEEVSNDHKTQYKQALDAADLSLRRMLDSGQFSTKDIPALMSDMSGYIAFLIAKGKAIYDDVMKMDEATYLQVFKGVPNFENRAAVAEEAAKGYVFGIAQYISANVYSPEQANTEPMRSQFLARIIMLFMPYVLGTQDLANKDAKKSPIVDMITGKIPMQNQLALADIIVEDVMQHEKILIGVEKYAVHINKTKLPKWQVAMDDNKLNDKPSKDLVDEYKAAVRKKDNAWQQAIMYVLNKRTGGDNRRDVKKEASKALDEIGKFEKHRMEEMKGESRKQPARDVKSDPVTKQETAAVTGRTPGGIAKSLGATAKSAKADQAAVEKKRGAAEAKEKPRPAKSDSELQANWDDLRDKTKIRREAEAKGLIGTMPELPPDNDGGKKSFGNK